MSRTIHKSTVFDGLDYKSNWKRDYTRHDPALDRPFLFSRKPRHRHSILRRFLADSITSNRKPSIVISTQNRRVSLNRDRESTCPHSWWSRRFKSSLSLVPFCFLSTVVSFPCNGRLCNRMTSFAPSTRLIKCHPRVQSLPVCLKYPVSKRQLLRLLQSLSLHNELWTVFGTISYDRGRNAQDTSMWSLLLFQMHWTTSQVLSFKTPLS